MFEYVKKRRDPVSLIFYCGCIPFGVAWALHQSFGTGFSLEAYLLTTLVFIVGPFEIRKQDAKQRWFWTVMLRTGAVVHPLTLVGLWMLDTAYPILLSGTGTLFLMAFA